MVESKKLKGAEYDKQIFELQIGKSTADVNFGQLNRILENPIPQNQKSIIAVSNVSGIPDDGPSGSDDTGGLLETGLNQTRRKRYNLNDLCKSTQEPPSKKEQTDKKPVSSTSPLDPMPKLEQNPKNSRPKSNASKPAGLCQTPSNVLISNNAKFSVGEKNNELLQKIKLEDVQEKCQSPPLEPID